eukprot:Hpha_TRINITY_DN15295_c3_g1::TRINITY_DN15295_c3_g1_i2::g.68474::m.68474/K01363/CTSB; cathepsin B
MRRVAVLAAMLAPAAGAISSERQALIDRVNSNANSLWKAGATRFAHQPVGASKSLCGVKDGHKEQLDKKVQLGKVKKISATGATLPSDFDSETNWPKCAKVIGDIRDQSNCGCCWAFGSASAASDRMCIATSGAKQVPLSAQELCFCSNSDGCDGGFPSDAWDFIQSDGLVTGAQQNFTLSKGSDPDPFAGVGYCSSFSLPHCHHHGPQGDDPFPAEGATGCPSESSPSCPRKCDSWAKAPHNVFKSDKHSFQGQTTTFDTADAIAEAIMKDGPVTAAFSVYSDFENYVSGIYQHTGGSYLGGHAIRIVGFGTDPTSGTKYWKVANSWNPHWGEKGYFRIIRGTNECGIEGQVVASNSGATWSYPNY